jgi:hypothetical protein
MHATSSALPYLAHSSHLFPISCCFTSNARVLDHLRPAHVLLEAQTLALSPHATAWHLLQLTMQGWLSTPINASPFLYSFIAEPLQKTLGNLCASFNLGQATFVLSSHHHGRTQSSTDKWRCHWTQGLGRCCASP